jgi:predicted XRE-type DNA-binding protein
MGKKRLMTKKLVEGEHYTPGGKSAFHDLGLRDADELVKRSELLYEICQKLEKMAMSHSEKRKLLGVGSTKYRNLIGGQISKFGLEDLKELKRRLLE